jgi:hypothetical protein
LNAKGCFVAALVALLTACGGTRDRKLEEQVVDALNAHKSDDLNALALAPYLKKSRVRLCLQGPYLEKDQFEKIIGRDAPGFDDLGGRAHALWIFYEDGTAAWVRIETKIMDRFPRRGNPCVTTANPRLGFDIENGRKKFYLMEG